MKVLHHGSAYHKSNRLFALISVFLFIAITLVFLGPSTFTAVAADITPPTVSVFPSNGQIIGSNNPFQIQVQYSDPGSGVNLSTFNLALDGIPLTACTVNATYALCSSGTLATGGHVITGSISDNAGNAALINVTFTVADNTPPYVSFINPAASGVLYDSPIDVSASYYDPDSSACYGCSPTPILWSGIDQSSVQVFLDGAAADASACTITATNVTCSLPVTSPGQHKLRVNVKDNAGNLGTSSDRYFYFYPPLYVIRDDPTGGDCATIGSWDAAAKLCMLGQDVSGVGGSGIEIAGDGITLDGNGHAVTDTYTAQFDQSGILVRSRSNVTIRNVTIDGFQDGVYVLGGTITIESNSISNCRTGIRTSASSSFIASNTVTMSGTGISDRNSTNTIASNTFHASTGAYIAQSVDNIHDNDMSGGSDGIDLYQTNGSVLNNNNFNASSTCVSVAASNNNTITNNQSINSGYSSNGYSVYLNGNGNLLVGNNIASNTSYGSIIMLAGSNNSIYGNVLDYRCSFCYSSGIAVSTYTNPQNNIFTAPLPVGGNQWIRHDSPDEGCTDANSDGFCDAPYNLWGPSGSIPALIDYLPRTVTGPDITPPTIANIWPRGTETNVTDVSFEFSDNNAPSSGINLASLAVQLDGIPMSGCSTFSGHAYCPIDPDIALGTHQILASIADNAGNVAQATGSFTLTDMKPPLRLYQPKPYWASYADYSIRALSADWQITNTSGVGRDVFDLQITVNQSQNNDGVILLTPLPLAVGDIPAGGTASFSCKYQVPESISRFFVYLSGEGYSSQGTKYYW